MSASSFKATRIVIGRVERRTDGATVHVSALDVLVPPGLPNGGTFIRVGHRPFEQSALKESVGELLGTGSAPAPEFETGYQHWKSANGGVYTLHVDQVLAGIFQILRSQSKAPPKTGED